MTYGIRGGVQGAKIKAPPILLKMCRCLAGRRTASLKSSKKGKNHREGGRLKGIGKEEMMKGGVPERRPQIAGRLRLSRFGSRE